MGISGLRRSKASRSSLLTVCAATAALALAACGGSSGSSAGKSGSPGTSPLVFAMFQPFSGPDASYGPPQLAACMAALTQIKAAGGILGDRNVQCKGVDTRGDPADAVPAADQLLSSTGGLVGIDGPTSDEAASTVPILNRGHVPMFSDTGQALFDNTHYPYFYRIVPSDPSVGYAMALYARQRGYTRAAEVFGTDIASQGSRGTVGTGFRALGGTIVANETIPLDETSYSTAVERVVAAHPQVIFTETDPQTAATFFTELRQLNGGKLIPFLGTDGTVEPPYFQALQGALGSAQFEKYYAGTQPYTPLSGPAYQAWTTGLRAAKSLPGMPGPISQWQPDGFAMMGWDAINLMALAMDEAKSSTPSVYNPYIVRVANGGPGAVLVHSYAEGLQSLKSGKQIKYVGALGPISFDSSHNSPGGFETINGNQKTLYLESSAQISSLARQSG